METTLKSLENWVENVSTQQNKQENDERKSCCPTTTTMIMILMMMMMILSLLFDFVRWWYDYNSGRCSELL